MEPWPDVRAALQFGGAHRVDVAWRYDRKRLYRRRRAMDDLQAAERVRVFLASMLLNPRRVDAILAEWLCNRSAEQDPFRRIMWLVRLLHTSPPMLEVSSDKMLWLFGAPQLALHFEKLETSERHALGAIIRDWGLYFTRKQRIVCGRSVSYRYEQCRHREAIAAVVHPDLLCARLFASVLAAVRVPTVRFQPGPLPPVSGAFLVTLQTLRRVYHAMARELPGSNCRMLDNVLRYGSLAIIDCAWDQRRRFLPHTHYALIRSLLI